MRKIDGLYIFDGDIHYYTFEETVLKIWRAFVYDGHHPLSQVIFQLIADKMNFRRDGDRVPVIEDVDAESPMVKIAEVHRVITDYLANVPADPDYESASDAGSVDVYENEHKNAADPAEPADQVDP